MSHFCKKRQWSFDSPWEIALQLWRCWESLALEADWSLGVCEWADLHETWIVNESPLWGQVELESSWWCGFATDEALGSQASWELVKSLVDCLTAFENWHCHYNPLASAVGQSKDVAINDLYFWLNLQNTKQRTSVLDFFFFTFFFVRNFKKELEATSKWWLLCSVLEIHSHCSAGVAGRGCLVLTFKRTYQTSLWAAEFLYLILPQQAAQRYLSVWLWSFYNLTVEWKELDN